MDSSDPTVPLAMKLKYFIKRLLKSGLIAGVLTFALGFANVFEQANPPIVLTLFAPYGQDLLAVGVIMAAISGAARSTTANLVRVSSRIFQASESHIRPTRQMPVACCVRLSGATTPFSSWSTSIYTDRPTTRAPIPVPSIWCHSADPHSIGLGTTS